MTPILAFDIETIPDCEGIRRLHDLPADLSDRDVAEVAFQKRRAQSGGASDFLLKGKLARPEFAERAPAEIVARERERLGEQEALRTKLQASLAWVDDGSR